jgi:hypothetical protein
MVMELSRIRGELYKLARSWEKKARLDPRNHFQFQGLLDEIFFHADLCFVDYVQYRNEGEFPTRLRNWLNNVSDDRDKKVLLELVSLIFFIDRAQMLSLYRDAFRRIVVPFISEGEFCPEDMLSKDYEKRILDLMRQYRICSITESFKNPDFIQANDLTGLPKPTILGEDKRKIGVMLPNSKKGLRGLIIFEDFVGTGKQARGVLIEVKRNVTAEWRLLFVPLIILEQGLKALCQGTDLASFKIEPDLVVSEASCIHGTARKGEAHKFKHIRAVVKSTANRVLEPLDETDDPPSHPFGYKGSGALIVTCHNTPNNTLPLIHHRSPDWVPLFRRIHHSKDGL